jgi:GNAT superfamily N-acetyltransferase
VRGARPELDRIDQCRMGKGKRGVRDHRDADERASGRDRAVRQRIMGRGNRLLMAAPFRNRGLATRALVLVADWGQSLGFVRLQLMMLPGNEASARIAAKAGFNEELAGPGPTSRTREGVATGATRQARPSERTQACRVARNTPRRSCTQDLLARIARMSYLPAAGTAGR